MAPLVTLLFLKVEGQNLVASGILKKAYFDVLSPKMALIFKFRASMTLL